MQSKSATPVTVPASDERRAGPPRSPPDSSGREYAGSNAAVSAEVILLLTEDHERIAQALNDVVVRRLFSAGLDLQGALALTGDHRVAAKLERVLGELDLAIRDFRNTVFNHWVTRSSALGEGRPPKRI